MSQGERPVSRPRVVVLRGPQANPWDLRPWERLAGEWDVLAPVIAGNRFDTSSIRLPTPRMGALSDWMPPGRLRDFAAVAPVNRYRGLEGLLRGAAIVHTAELSYWFSAQAARMRERLGFRLAVTIWETIPFLGIYRHPVSRRNRAAVLAAADVFLPASDRAAQALRLEGVEEGRIRVLPPGIDLDRFGVGPPPEDPAGERLIVSAGRLVWEKGHQDVLRALAALRRGLVPVDAEAAVRARVLVIGNGPEGPRLRAYARELGLGDAVEFRAAVPYDEMPGVYARASCLVLGSLPVPMWEEQFGMVLAEAMAGGLPILASASGAIPEVAGEHAGYFEPGDWLGLARRLADGPLARPAGERVDYEPERVRRHSTEAAAARLDAEYRRLLGEMRPA
jgi:glycosyltransferase involved in cell wall biosynthesis